jgi:hypothetical protein
MMRQPNIGSGMGVSPRRRTAAGVARDGFALPRLGPVLARLRDGVTGGCGVALPVSGLGEEQCEWLSLGLARHLGGIVPQGAAGHLLMHVRDAGADPAAATTRSYQHSGRLGYHADPKTWSRCSACGRPGPAA